MAAPFKRPVPPDFAVVFREKGRLECEAHYRARRTTVTWWLEQIGKDLLIDQRADFVRFKRARARQQQRRRTRHSYDGGQHGFAT